MGKRGEVYSTRITTEDGKKTFFFNVKQNFYKDYYLSIVESRKMMESVFRRSTIIVFDNHLEEFIVRLEQACQFKADGFPAPEIKFSVGDGRREYKIVTLERSRDGAVKIIEHREDSTGSHRDAIFVEIDFLDIFLARLRSVAQKIEELPRDLSKKVERNRHNREE